jgi:hypothetical protein
LTYWNPLSHASSQCKLSLRTFSFQPYYCAFSYIGSLARYELLNCGYNAGAAVETIDTLMASYITELAIAVDTLSTSLTSDEELLAKQFDEQHVHAALDLLRAAGLLSQKLYTFQQRTRERLRSLCSGMRASIAHDEDATTDSLSLVEVAALLAREVVGVQQSNALVAPGKPKMTTASTIAQLQHLSGESRSRGGGGGAAMNAMLPTLYPESIAAMNKLTKAGQTFVFDILCSVPRMWLRSVATMPVWRGGGDLGSAISSFTGLGDNYNKLPQQYITQIGEHILALVQALEPFASSHESLVIANEVMSGVKTVAAQPWKDLVSSAGCGINIEDEAAMQALMKGKDMRQHPALLQGAAEQGFYEDEDMDDDEEGDANERAAATFCNEWLDVVCSAVTGRLLERILRISRLSQSGCAHMEADLNYVINVFSALGIQGHPHPLLVHFVGLVAMSDEDLAARIEMPAEAKDDVSRLLKSVEQQLASMRGIGLN